jgi:hypothetical protein
VELVLFFLATWLIGGMLTALTFWLTRGSPWRVQANLRSLALAVTLTPTLVFAPHAAALGPAVVVVIYGLFMPNGWPYVPAGVIPIALVWAVLRLLWPREAN